MGVTLLALTVVFLAYSLILYFRRAIGLRARDVSAPYDDRFGPTFLATVLFTTLIANAVISYSRGMPSGSVPQFPISR